MPTLEIHFNIIQSFQIKLETNQTHLTVFKTTETFNAIQVVTLEIHFNIIQSFQIKLETNQTHLTLFKTTETFSAV